MTISKLALEVDSVKVKDAASALGLMAKEGQKAESVGNKMRTAFGRLRDIMQGPIAAIGMVANGFRQLKAQTDRMELAWKVQERAVSNLEAVLKATGGAAGLSSKELQDMAASLQKVTTFGDETIISAQAVMLTFKEIGRDIFPDAMEAAMDLSTIMGGDLQGATVMLGKALNEPVQGITALRRVGVQLTDQQEASIKAFMDVNDLASAQAVIMGEVQSQFGGAAKAAGETGSALKDKLANAISDVNEQIGRSLTNNLAPWRQAWLNMAEAIGASLKATNDFTDAMARANKGTDTQEDRLLIAKDYLKVLQDSHALAKGGGALAEMYGDPTELQSQISNQLNYIRGLEQQVYWEGKLAGAKAIEDKNAAAAELRKANTLVDIEKRKQLESDTAAEIRKIIDQEKNRMITADQMGEKILEAYKLELDALYEMGYAMDRGGEIGQARFAMLAGYLAYDPESVANAAKEAEENASALAAALATIQQPATFGTDDMLDRWEDLPIRIKAATVAQNEYTEAAVNGFTSMGSAMGTAIVAGEGLGEAMKNAFKEAVASMIEMKAKLWTLEAIAAFATGNIPSGVGFTAAATAAYAGAGVVRAMAEGGEGTVTKPTLFLAGEAGPEDYSFVPKSKGGMSGGGGVTQIFNIGGSVIAERQVKQLALAGMAQAGRGY